MPDPDESWDAFNSHNNCALHAVLTMLKLWKHPEAPSIPENFAQLQQIQQSWLKRGLIKDTEEWPAMSHSRRSKILKFYGIQLLPVYEDLWTDAATDAEGRETDEHYATLQRLCGDERLCTSTTCGIVRVEPRCCELCADPVTCSHRHAFSFESGGTVETLKFHDQSVSVFVQTPSTLFWRRYADYVVTGVHEAVYDSGHGDGGPAGRGRVKQAGKRITRVEDPQDCYITRVEDPQDCYIVEDASESSAAGSKKRKGQS